MPRLRDKLRLYFGIMPHLSWIKFLLVSTNLLWKLSIWIWLLYHFLVFSCPSYVVHLWRPSLVHRQFHLALYLNLLTQYNCILRCAFLKFLMSLIILQIIRLSFSWCFLLCNNSKTQKNLSWLHFFSPDILAHTSVSILWQLLLLWNLMHRYTIKIVLCNLYVCIWCNSAIL